jgi:hypothetical protein
MSSSLKPLAMPAMAEMMEAFSLVLLMSLTKD